MLQGCQKLLAKAGKSGFSLWGFFKYYGAFPDGMGRGAVYFIVILCWTQCDGQGFKPNWSEL